MGRTAKALLVSGCCLQIIGSACAARAEEADSADNTAWTTYADCAAGYLANWHDRLSSPERGRDMSNMIRRATGNIVIKLMPALPIPIANRSMCKL